ncbi:MAG: YceI family protein [Chitinophagaceae bacterium]|nr:YceI family protein [Chitinophagaceae bacterium]MCB9045048.1 YceI family protein [Chitinophagales bacterium]
MTILSGTILLASCQDAPKADNAEASEAQETEQVTGTDYVADVNQSKVEWVGTKPVGQHHGTFSLQNGTLIVSDNMLQGGNFTIDIKSLAPDDQNDEYNAKLQGHLLSPDFFDAENHPTGTFEITNVTEGTGDTNALVMKDATHMITGNLTLKGITKSITFPAKVDMNNGNVTADANFNIDRTQWEMVYGNDQSLGDKFIRPEVNLQVHLVANQQM